MARDKPVTLNALHREVLSLLAAGGIMTIDKASLAAIGHRAIHLFTRSVLIGNGLVTQLQQGKRIGATGNGYAISDRGRRLLHGQA